MFYVYVLAMNNGEIYIGFSTNLKNRIKQHYENKVISTKNREPKLVYYEAYISKKDAIEREQKLKQRGNAKRWLKERITNSLNQVTNKE